MAAVRGIRAKEVFAKYEAVTATVRRREALRYNLSFSARKRQIPTVICRFQLNPPLRVGEIVFDDEIQLRWVKSASTADGWI